jgi:molybdopterin-binding protein
VAKAWVIDLRIRSRILANARFFLYFSGMSEFRIGEAAHIVGVSSDTIRRWVDQDRLSATRTDGGQRLVAGADLARLVTELNEADHNPDAAVLSARNRFPGLITRVLKDKVMTQVEMQAGPHRVVSLMSTEAANDLGLEPGVRAVAVVKSTNVVVEVPKA